MLEDPCAFAMYTHIHKEFKNSDNATSIVSAFSRSCARIAVCKCLLMCQHGQPMSEILVAKWTDLHTNLLGDPSTWSMVECSRLVSCIVANFLTKYSGTGSHTPCHIHATPIFTMIIIAEVLHYFWSVLLCLDTPCQSDSPFWAACSLDVQLVCFQTQPCWNIITQLYWRSLACTRALSFVHRALPHSQVHAQVGVFTGRGGMKPLKFHMTSCICNCIENWTCGSLSIPFSAQESRKSLCRLRVPRAQHAQMHKRCTKWNIMLTTILLLSMQCWRLAIVLQTEEGSLVM